ncbi:MAG: hypothetical protein VKK42_16255, partial [Lyngbya sp.]|nr:hypothetical protein [Lyngbya sp.]
QESEVRRNEEFRKGRSKNYSSIFLSLSPQNTKFLNPIDLKACTFSKPKNAETFTGKGFEI